MATSIYRIKEMILKMEAASSSSPATLITTYCQRTHCSIPKDFGLQKHCCEKLKFKKFTSHIYSEKSKTDLQLWRTCIMVGLQTGLEKILDRILNLS
jgi:hypothetical protein